MSRCLKRSEPTRALIAALVLLSAHGAPADPPAKDDVKNHCRWYDPRRYVDRCRQFADDVQRVEIVEMLSALAHGQPPDVGKGWFHDGQGRYGWRWLADRFDANGDGEISAEEFPPESRDLLTRLDRNQDGKIKADDFDWSPQSPYVQQMGQTRRLFGPIDADRNGQVTKEEWRDFFERAALDADSITPADLQAALFPPQPAQPDDDPSPLDFVRGFVSGELGAIPEGPALGGRAPDFELDDQQHERRIRLSNLYQKKPVVLIFGSFT
jgi:Ca2+-binding EF-hand superfamily protein